VTRLPRALLQVVLVAGGTPVLARAQEHAEEGGATLFDVNLGLSLWTVVIFLGLLAILWKFAWGPILGAAATRERRIQEALDEAAGRQAEALRMMEEQKAQLADARRQVQEIIAEGKSAGERVRREIEEKARGEAQGIIERARKEITREKEAASQELGATRERVIDAVGQRLDLPRKHALDAYTMAEQHETNPRSVWGYVQGLTRLSQHTPWQETRFTLDRAASRLLATVH
jgi:F-type H+-transporting ATPase subunit b